MPTYKLKYFNARGRAEPARILFTLAGVKFEDCRLTGEEYHKIKPDLPFGQLPVLEVTESGKTTTIAQSHAISRYLAREFKLYGKTSLDKARCDTIVDHMIDIFSKIPFFEKDAAKKEEMMKEALEVSVPEKLRQLEKYVNKNGYFIGDSITIAEIHFQVGLEMIKPLCPEILSKTKKLEDLYEKVVKHKKIAAWIASRPKSDF